MAKIIVSGKPIQIIQGDSFSYRLYPKMAEIVEEISKVVFTSTDLGINEEMRVENGKYVYDFSSQKTKGLEPKSYTFDFTVHFNDGAILSATGLLLQVIKKQNPES